METTSTDVLGMLTRLLDSLDEELMLIDLNGRIVHQNPAIRRGSGTGGGTAKIDARLGEITRRVGCWKQEAATGGQDLEGVIEQEVVLPEHAVRVRACHLPIPSATGGGLVVISLYHRPPGEAQAEYLKARYHLTEQEGRVALLLIRRRTNEEIARELSISDHTARHHTQHILAKLGVHSRRRVAAVLGRDQSLAEGRES